MQNVPGSILFLLASGSALGAQPAPPRRPIKPPFDCIQIPQINAWHIVDDRTLTVGNGPRLFRVDLPSRCPQLGYGSPSLRFRANPSNRAIGNAVICGEVGESVSGEQPPPCPIQSVTRIDKPAYRRLNLKSRQGGSGAKPHGSP